MFNTKIVVTLKVICNEQRIMTHDPDNMTQISLTEFWVLLSGSWVVILFYIPFTLHYPELIQW